MGSSTSKRRPPAAPRPATRPRRAGVHRLLWVGIVASVLVVMAVVVAQALADAPSNANSASGDAQAIRGLTTYTGLSRDHTDGAVAYEQNPPVGGAHSPVWQNCGWYDAPVPAENAVHTLEHSAVWITYSPDLSATDVAALKSELSGRDYVLASPYAGLPGKVVATAWGAQVVLDGVSDPRLLEFVDAFAGASTAPEPGGECTGGAGNPS